MPWYDFSINRTIKYQTFQDDILSLQKLPQNGLVVILIQDYLFKILTWALNLLSLEFNAALIGTIKGD